MEIFSPSIQKTVGDGPHQHHRHGGQQQQVIAQQECLAGQRFETGIAAQRRMHVRRTASAPPATTTRKPRMKGTAFRIVGEGMHRGQHARTHQERAQQTHGKSDNRQQHRPGAEHVALFTDRQRMDQRCPGQPGQQGGIFYRIPEPPATPTQFVIGPPEPSAMPTVRKHQATVVQGRAHRAQAGSRLPASKPAMAKAKATRKPT